jgi:hypothetical protein
MSRKLLAAAAVCLLIVAPRAVADDAKYVKLVNGDTGKVLSIENDSTDAEARAVLAKDGNSESQQWKLVKDGDHYKLVNKKSGKVLDVYGESLDEDGPIIQWDDKDEGNDNQRWSWAGDGKSRRLKAKSSGLVLDVDKEGKIVQRKADDKAKSQLWEVVEVKK